MAVWRRRLFRGLSLLAAVAALAFGVAVYHWTDPDTVRQLVIDGLRKQFPGADVSLDSARLRILGGITFQNLTLTRRDDPTRAPFVQVPSGVIYHDKQALSRGKLALRKVALERPRFTVVRHADGRLNVQGVLGPVNPTTPVPTLTVSQGVIVGVIEAGPRAGDAAGVRPVSHVEVREVSLSILNDPRPVLQFAARGTMAGCGAVRFEGSLERATERLTAALDWPDVPLDVELLQQFAPLLPPQVGRVEQVGGRLGLHLELATAPNTPPKVVALAELRDGSLRAPDLPLPLDGVRLSARYDAGRIDATVSEARVGGAATTLTLSAKSNGVWRIDPDRKAVDGPLPLAVERLTARLVRLPVNDALWPRLPESFRKAQQRFQPAGPLTLGVQFARADGTWTARVAMQAEGMTSQFGKFPYPLADIRGTIVQTLAAGQDDRFEIDLNGAINEGRRLTVAGWVRGGEPDPEIYLDIAAADAPLDETLVQSLPPKFQTLARSFHVAGRGDVVANIRHQRHVPEGRDRYEVKFHDARMCYDVFPVPLDAVSGVLEIQTAPKTPGRAGTNDRFRFRDFVGHRHGGVVRFEGSNDRLPGGGAVDIRMSGERLPLDGGMALAFQQLKLGSTWDSLSPSGRLDFEAEVAHTERPGDKPDLAVTVRPRGAAIRPTFFPYALTDLDGQFHYRDGRVMLAGFRAKHGRVDLALDAGDVRTVRGGFWAELQGIRCGTVVPDEAFLSALPPSVRKAFDAMRFRGALNLQLNKMVIDDTPKPGTPRPEVYWTGAAGLSGATFETGLTWEDARGGVACEGLVKGGRLTQMRAVFELASATVGRQPVEQVGGQLVVLDAEPEVIRFTGLHAKLFGGDVTGQARVAAAGSVGYDLALAATGVRLEELARHNKLGGPGTRLEGALMAQLDLHGRQMGLAELEGRGTLDVPAGRIYNLPFVLDLLKTVSLRSPDGAAFDEAHAAFKIAGDTVEVERLDLLGNLVSLGGHGTVKLDGSNAMLDFYAVWARLGQVLPESLGDWPEAIGRNLVKIQMRGMPGGFHYKVEPLPGIVDPVRELMARMKRRTDR